MGNSVSGSNAVCVRLDREAYPSGSNVSGNVYVHLQEPGAPITGLHIKVWIQTWSSIWSGKLNRVGIIHTRTFSRACRRSPIL